MPLSDREELELLELEEKEKAGTDSPSGKTAPAESFAQSATRAALDYGAPVIGAVGGGILGSSLGPAGTAGGAGLGYAAGKEVAGLGKHYLLGDQAPSTEPLDVAGRVAGNAAEGAAAELAGPLVGSIGAKVAPVLKSAAESFATSSIPSKVAKYTNATGLIKDTASKIFEGVTPNLSPRSKQVADFITGAAGRKFAYSNPVTGIPQAVSDAAQGVKASQSAVAKLLDAAPHKLGKYAPVLKAAAERGGQALATTNFLLQSRDPEYQKIVTDQQNQN